MGIAPAIYDADVSPWQSSHRCRVIDIESGHQHLHRRRAPAVFSLLSPLPCLVECARSSPSSNARTWPAGPTTVLCLPLTPILVYAPEIVIPGNLSHHQPEPARARGPTQDARQLATSPHAIMADKEYRIQGFRNELQQYWCHPAASGRPQLDPIPDADLLRPVRHRESNSSLHPRRSVRP